MDPFVLGTMTGIILGLIGFGIVWALLRRYTRLPTEKIGGYSTSIGVAIAAIISELIDSKFDDPINLLIEFVFVILSYFFGKNTIREILNKKAKK